MKPAKFILPLIVFAQFCCTSLWFASNGILNELIEVYQLPVSALGSLTSSVQLGFITGTLVFAALTLSDRFSPSKVFFVSALLGALFNLMIIWGNHSFWSLNALRFSTGFCLAGIYPVGMKIAADYFDQGLGKSLGFLVGALVLGTAFPHLLRGLSSAVPWEGIIIFTSVMALAGGLSMVLFVPDGPFRRKSPSLQLSAFVKVFKNHGFRKAAFGYFGHMWELYAFWALIPVLLKYYNDHSPYTPLNVSLLAFAIIAIGSLGCIIAGYASIRIGAKRTGFIALLLSGLCCLISPLIFETGPVFFIFFLLFWGFMVIADSPMFSTLVAHSAPKEFKGTALTITNCIGFAITIGSIQLLTYLVQNVHPTYSYLVLAIGPLSGLLALSLKIDKTRY
ncbi:MAG: MFS transporter [Bacteroidota bacterium]